MIRSAPLLSFQLPLFSAEADCGIVIILNRDSARILVLAPVPFTDSDLHRRKRPGLAHRLGFPFLAQGFPSFDHSLCLF